MNIPQVSVILPVYNGEAYLQTAMDSVLTQDFDDFEFIIIDDGSQDNTPNIVQAYHDSRIRFLANENNLGLPETLNRGIREAQGKYIARMDHDDISLPGRFGKQVYFLDEHPDVAATGTWSKIWAGDKPSWRVYRPPADSVKLAYRLHLECPLVHSSMMLRKHCLEKVGMYNKNTIPEDYDLWSRLMREYRLSNIPEILHIYRKLPDSVLHSHREKIRQGGKKTTHHNLVTTLGISAESPEVRCLINLLYATSLRDVLSPCIFKVQAILYQLADKISARYGTHPSRLSPEVKRIYSYYWVKSVFRVLR